MQSPATLQATAEEVLGYLNFSSGAPDPKFLRSLNELFRQLSSAAGDDDSVAGRLERLLLERLEQLEAQGGAFADTSQARALIPLLFGRLLESYHQFHQDLLFHQSRSDLTQPFLIGRMAETVLVIGPPWDEEDRIIQTALRDLNDYIGYRPVAVLESDQKIEPYDHERVRPIPLYIAQAGVAVGRYEALIAKTLQVLEATDPRLLARAWFDPSVLDELALDPRAYDFDHPVNRRPNYHFGQWDAHQIDTKGRYHRFIVQQVTLDALLARLTETAGDEYEQRLLESATVLAGTILMASGTSGHGPDTHDSSTTLATLLPHIAAYRDDFYEFHLARLTGPHGDHLRQEAEHLRQPFGGARQHLNQELARLRATQLQYVHLAQLFARMGYPEAATRQAQTVQVASARMLCEIYCRLTLAHRAIDRRKLDRVVEHVTQIEGLLHRGIECGALVDPWNIVGFGGNFSLFPALENSIHDYRIDALVDLIEQIFSLTSRAWSEAAAQDNESLEADFSGRFERLAHWWDQFAATSVSGVRHVVGKELQVSTNLVAGALSAWHKAGAAAGDVGFWRMFVDQFDSPKAFQIVVEALMEKGDRVASMALLIQWLSQGERINLADGDSSFHRLAERWLSECADGVSEAEHEATEQAWQLARKFFDYMEANAESLWNVPHLDLAGVGSPSDSLLEDDAELAIGADDDEEDDGQLYSAAYEQMTYRDSTDDGIDGEVLEPGAGNTDYELEQESERLTARLAYLRTLARLWRTAASTWGAGPRRAAERDPVFHAWRAQAETNYADLLELLEAVRSHRLPAPTGTHDSLVEYDRRRTIKEGLLEQIISTAVEMADAKTLLAAASHALPADAAEEVELRLLHAVLDSNVERVLTAWPSFLESLDHHTLLYIPLSRQGEPDRIVRARSFHKMLWNLLDWLPRLGLIREACGLLESAQQMELNNPVGPGAVTEYDRLFEAGYKRIVETIVVAAADWQATTADDRRSAHEDDVLLVDCLQQLTESQLKRWLNHSRTLRLSVVEKLSEESAWNQFQEFILSYGADLFTQKFLGLGNLRAILYQGVDAWLAQLEAEESESVELKLLDDLAATLSRTDAIKYLSIAFEAVVENYGEYRDYNSTTTQSDRGELLFTLIDFLRLRNDYDRIAWNLRPVILAHEIVVRNGRGAAAELWRRQLAERTAEVADHHQQRLEQLVQKYGMRLPTVSDRIGERFIRPLTIDRVRSLVRPAMEAAADEPENTSFSLLEQEIVELAREPVGVGFDIPTWLAALEAEVATLRSHQRHGRSVEELHHRVPLTPISREALQEQLDALSDDS